MPPYILTLAEAGEWRQERPGFSHRLTLSIAIENDNAEALQTALSLMGMVCQRHRAELIYNKEFVLASGEAGQSDISYAAPTFVADVLSARGVLDFVIALERNDFKLRPLGSTLR